MLGGAGLGNAEIIVVLTGNERSKRYRLRHPERVKARRKKYLALPETKEKQRQWQRTADAKREPQRRAEQIRRAMRKHRKAPSPTRPALVRCECCGGPPNGKGVLHSDHDHAAHKFRGWLCASCNLGIGLLQDTLTGVKNAVAYLEKNG